MKPLIVVTSYNRHKETVATLKSLKDTGAFEQAQKVVVVENGSRDGSAYAVWKLLHRTEYRNGEGIFFSQNIGCPRALNLAMKRHRQPGQTMIKVDNDVRLVTASWVDQLQAFLDDHQGEVAMIGPWYPGIDSGRNLHDRGEWAEIYPLVGHCVAHAGWFLDQVGFFDVLAPDHFYGFEDLLMCHRATARGYKCGAMKNVFQEMLQRHSSLDVGADMGENEERRDNHVSRLRPLYQHRTYLVNNLGDSYYVGPDGQIVQIGQTEV